MMFGWYFFSILVIVFFCFLYVFGLLFLFVILDIMSDMVGWVLKCGYMFDFKVDCLDMMLFFIIKKDFFLNESNIFMINVC